MADVTITETGGQNLSLEDDGETKDLTWSQYVSFTVDERFYGIEVNQGLVSRDDRLVALLNLQELSGILRMP